MTLLMMKYDPALVALAAGVCGLACLTYVNMLGRAAVARRRARVAWTAGSAVAFGSGAWATHFIALVGMHGALRPAFALAPLAASLGLAILGGAGATVTRLRNPPPAVTPLRWRIGGGMLLGACVAGMHFTGMAALRRAGLIIYEPGVELTAIAVGTILTSLGMAISGKGRRTATACLLALAVVALHFIAMAGTELVPWAPGDMDGDLVPSESMALLMGIAIACVLLLSLVGTAVDAVLARRATDEARRLRQFADATFEGILFCRAGIITDVNDALAGLGGWQADALIGHPLEDLFVPETGAALRPLTQGIARDTLETELIAHDGSTHPVEVLCRTIEQEAVPTMVVAIRDISERKAAERRIGELAYFDTLTGCGNRLLFRDRLAQVLETAQHTGHALAVLCCDLDRFKEVNDVLGHAVGDKVLIEVADRLRARLRDTDTLARLGGDGFAVIQPRITCPEDAAALAERIVSCLGQPFDIDGVIVQIGASVGIGLYPQNGTTGEALLRTADVALYRSKQGGRGTFHFYTPEMDAELRQRHMLEQDLAQAVARGELMVHYQPLFETASLRLVGHEALVRWRHPERGAISPEIFIPLAEQCGLIAPIGEHVLHVACVAAAAAAGPARIAVNLSPVQVRTSDLPRIVAETLHATGLAAERLELEITEGVLIDDVDHTLSVLLALKRLGVRIVLDDFGTGYSSLSYLRRFPFDKLKIDRSFMQGLGEDGDSDALVRSILALGHSMHMVVTAEGVETETQLAVLQRYGCDQVQGYLVGRPGPTLVSDEIKAVPVAA